MKQVTKEQLLDALVKIKSEFPRRLDPTQLPLINVIY